MTFNKSDYIGFMTLSNTSGLGIIGIFNKDYNPYVKIHIIAFNDVCSEKNLKVYSSNKGHYFNLFKTRIYLNEFVRVI